MSDFLVLSNGYIDVTLCTIGASIYDIKVPDKNGFKDSILATPYDMNDFQNATSFFGKTIGRTGGRIANNKFILDDIEYNIKSNDPNGLHGGIDSIAYKKFSYDIEVCDLYKKVIFTYISPDMESGYPGEVEIKVVYKLYLNKNTIEVEYIGKTNKKTLLNLSNHAYFNLSGSINENILNHNLYINSSKLERIENALPVEIIEANKTYSFKKNHKIKDYLFESELIDNTNGYDHPYIFDNVGLEYDNIILYDEKSGRKLRINTTYPVVVIYTCNYPEDLIVNNGKKLKAYDAICLECQIYPNNINSDFLSEKKDILNPSDTYNHKIVYNFE